MTQLLVGAACAVAGWLVTRPAVEPAIRALRSTRVHRPNYRGAEIPMAMGVVLAVPLVAGAAAAAIVITAGIGLGRGAPGALLAGLSFGALGLLDDVYGNREAGGFAGHLAALVRGRPTTGAVKALGGGLVGIAAAWVTGERGWWVLVGGAVVALSANLVNLLDLRPGRAAKTWLVGWVALWAASPPVGVVAVSAALAGGLVAYLPADLGERGALGDTGANLLGAVLGVVAVASLGHAGQAWAAGALALLTALSEVVSFSSVIDRVGVLRALDRLGRGDQPTSEAA